jgi:2-succinyl-6-hydroxy-2,4-cyclohexadiene-1-carboxylate synthase
MGGRIALHMLLDQPERWRRAVIVSASPGLPKQERASRLEADKKWAERFRTEPWDELMEAWNGQAVFQGEPEPDRDEADYQREDLALALERGSVGDQEDLRARLAALEITILWIAGENDAKYAALAEECAALNPRFAHNLIEGAGHRAPWTAREQFQSVLTEFLER